MRHRPHTRITCSPGNPTENVLPQLPDARVSLQAEWPFRPWRYKWVAGLLQCMISVMSSLGLAARWDCVTTLSPPKWCYCGVVPFWGLLHFGAPTARVISSPARLPIPPLPHGKRVAKLTALWQHGLRRPLFALITRNKTGPKLVPAPSCFHRRAIPLADRGVERYPTPTKIAKPA